jgi:hypothetical protein
MSQKFAAIAHLIRRHGDLVAPIDAIYQTTKAKSLSAWQLGVKEL